MIAVVDYKKGNLRSVERGLCNVGADARIVQDPNDILKAAGIVLPGVGAFADAMGTMNELGQTEAIRKAVQQGVPFLGICLGMHLMFEAGEEHAAEGSLTPGVGLIPGVVRKMPRTNAQGKAFKVPHVGWNTIDMCREEKTLFRGLSEETYMYFTHSYIAPSSEATIATTTHSVTFPCAVRVGNAFGVQFHPEKSSDAGSLILKNFVEFVRKA